MTSRSMNPPPMTQPPMTPLALRVAPPALPMRAAPVGAILRVALLVVAIACGLAALRALPARAEGATPALRGDIVAKSDVLTLGELVADVPEALAGRPLFRAPALGATGTIQSRRIVEAAIALGVGPVETGGRTQISVQRAARRIGAVEIEAAVKRALEGRIGLDARTVTISFDGELPQLLVPPDLTDPATAVEASFDPRTRRVAALIVVGARQASLRVSGAAIETVEVATLTRALQKGATVQEADLALERRPRDGLPSDMQPGGAPLVGQVAQRALGAGAIVRTGDLARAELVARGEAVTIVFETPGVSLALRGRATDGGALGDTVTVVNPVSKKTLQATVIGPGRVTVGSTSVPARVASAGQP